jgi:hypothetical protein
MLLGHSLNLRANQHDKQHHPKPLVKRMAKRIGTKKNTQDLIVDDMVTKTN